MMGTREEESTSSARPSKSSNSVIPQSSHSSSSLPNRIQPQNLQPQKRRVKRPSSSSAPATLLPTPTAPKHYAWSRSDFYFGRVIGQGLYGKVYIGKCKQPSQHDNNDIVRRRPQLFVPNTNNTPEAGSNNIVAIKTMDKYEIIKQKQMDAVMKEKNILSMFTQMNTQTSQSSSSFSSQQSSSWVVSLIMSFVDTQNLYLIMEYLPMTLDQLFKKEQQKQTEYKSSSLTSTSSSTTTTTTTDTTLQLLANTQYFSSQILCAIEYLHSHHVVHRDLKPENIALTSATGRIKLIDFGCALHLVPGAQTTTTKTNDSDNHNAMVDFVGTADYACPEVIRGHHRYQSNDSETQAESNLTSSLSSLYAIDLWSYGCLLYFMLQGESPFHSESDYITIGKIMEYANTSSTSIGERVSTTASSRTTNELDFCNKWPFPNNDLPNDAVNLISQLLQDNPYSRLGMMDVVKHATNNSEKVQYISIKSHPFFKEQSWEDIALSTPSEVSTTVHHVNNDSQTRKGAETVASYYQEDEMMDGATLDFDFFS